MGVENKSNGNFIDIIDSVSAISTLLIYHNLTSPISENRFPLTLQGVCMLFF